MWGVGMKVGVLYEQSGIVRDAFRKAGHDAYSVDKQPSNSAYHIQDDAMKHLRGWDMIIMHPECTAIAVSGNATYAKGKPKWSFRLAAVEYTQKVWILATMHCRKVCMENPVGVLNTMSDAFPKPQYVQPWMFGHGETKKTGLWLHGLPQLIPTNVVAGREQRVWKMPPSAHRGYLRAITYQGIADAMAEQWGCL